MVISAVMSLYVSAYYSGIEKQVLGESERVAETAAPEICGL